MVDVDVVGSQAFEGALNLLEDVVTGRAYVVLTRAKAEGGLGGDEDALAGKVFDGLTQNLFGETIGVDVGGVEEVDTSFDADVDELAGLCDVGLTPGFEELIASTEGSGAEAEYGDFEAGVAKLTKFHLILLGGCNHE